MNRPTLATAGTQLPPGSHVCWLAASTADYLCDGAAFLGQAHQHSQKPVLFGPDGSRSRAQLEPRAAVVADPLNDFLNGGEFKPAAMIEEIEKQSAHARAEGYQGLRLLADMDWLLPAHPEPSAVAAFETCLDRAAIDLGATIICAYQPRSIPACVIHGVLAVHSTVRGHDASPLFRFICNGGKGWRLSGEVDIESGEVLAAALGAAAAFGDCVIDVNDLDYIDLTGIQAIVRAARDTGAHVELRGAQAVLCRYWQVCDLDRAAPSVTIAA